MPEISIRDVTVRTTADGAGHPHMVVTGNGAVPEEALADLAGAAQAVAERIAEELSGRRENHDRPDTEWRFEVVDVRLVAGPPQSDDYRWIAYGTLASAGATPWAASYWDGR